MNHSEPWKSTTDGSIRNAEGQRVVNPHAFSFQRDRARVVQCVNALAGLDPSELQPLLKAAEAILEPCTGKERLKRERALHATINFLTSPSAPGKSRRRR